jgi:hypothetical protein
MTTLPLSNSRWQTAREETNVLPQYPFVVTVTTAAGPRQSRTSKSFETLPAALVYAQEWQRRPACVRVSVEMRIEEWSRSTDQDHRRQLHRAYVPG